MKHDIDPFHRLAQSVVFADIDAMKIDSPAYLVQIPLIPCKQVVYNYHPVRAARQETAY